MQYRINIAYRIGEKKYNATGSNEHFVIKDTGDEDIINLILIPKTDIRDFSFSVSMPVNLTENTFFYSNGFQSWSYSKEYCASDKYEGINPLLHGIVDSQGGLVVGDYSFVKYPKKRGIFNSSFHCYFREKNSDIITLYGSLNERSGYTAFTADMNTATLRASKDIEGVKLYGEYNILNIVRLSGKYESAFDNYFNLLGIKARTDKKLKGYSSWYNYYRNINEHILTRDFDNMLNSGYDFNVFQIDDGYQPAIGDITAIDPVKFPHTLKPIVDKIHSAGKIAGLWCCPFGVTAKSNTFKNHKDWLLKDSYGKPIKTGAAWGGFYSLDFYNMEARDYIRKGLETMIRDWGFDMLKLDFLYSAAVIPQHGKSRAEVMYEIMEFLRETLGEDKLFLACGAPIAPAAGIADYCRIGADVALSWRAPLENVTREFVSTKKTVANTVFRRYLSGRAFLNDPDVFNLRKENISMTFSQSEIIATVNKLFGDVLFTSDNVGDYDEQSKAACEQAFKEDDIEILAVNYPIKNVIRIDYRLNGELKMLAFDHIKGELCKTIS